MKDDKINNLREELMEKIDNIKEDVTNIRVDIAGLPKLLADEFDKRYASKSIEAEIEKIKEKSEERNYEWLKWLIMSLAGIVFGIVSFIITKTIQ